MWAEIKDGSARTAMCIHGGATFIWPFVQAYKFLDLNPINLSIEIIERFTYDNQGLSLKIKTSVAIGTKAELMPNAAERLLGLEPTQIGELASDIIEGQARICVAERELSEVIEEKNEFLEALIKYANEQLGKIGLFVINMNILSAKEL